MASSVEDKVKQIIVEQLGVDESEVTPTASFIDDPVEVTTVGQVTDLVAACELEFLEKELVNRTERLLDCAAGFETAADRFGPGIEQGGVSGAIYFRVAGLCQQS